MTLLVTGASGRLGREVVRQARAEGRAVLGLDITPSDTAEAFDLRKDELAPKLEGVTAVIHCAALHGRHLDLGLSHQAFIDTNISATLRLIETAKQAGASRFVYTSTTSIYGKAMVDADKAVWVDENLAPKPRDIYDITKQAAEALCADAFAPGFVTTVLRVSRFMDESANHIANYRLYRGLDERDGAAAHLLAASAPLRAFECFNVSNRSPFGRDDVAELKRNAPAVIRRYYPEVDAWYQARGWQLPASIDRVYDISKARRLLGYAPRFNFEVLAVP